MKIIILLTMIFLHIVDDYYLQGILAQLKQKSWWEENYPAPIYKHDYLVALITHAFSWSFMIMLPFTALMVVTHNYKIIPFTACFIVNWIIHSIVDDLKANKRKISLKTDQLIHLAQILVTWIVMNFLI